MTVIICNLALLVLIDAFETVLTRELVLCVCHPRTPRARFPCSPSSLCRESPSPLPSGGEEGSVLYTGNIRRVLVCFNAKALGNE